MSFKLNPFTGQFDDVGTSSATPTYANFAAFPASATDGSLAVALDTDLLYIYDDASATWKLVGVFGLIKVTTYDPIATSTTSGPAISSPYYVDGVLVITGSKVLFSNLSVNNNRVYQATVTGPVISWTALNVFTGSLDPVLGDTVIVQQGNAFQLSVGKFDSVTWTFNSAVRYFNGTDYFEQDALATSTLTDNTVNGTVFSVGFSGSENILVDYSMIRGTSKETGTLAITTDNTNVAVSTQGAATADLGVLFNGIISGGDLILRYTTTSTGSDVTMKYSLRRWSDNAGGPNGVPSYSASSSSITAAGSNQNIQFNNSSVLGANTNFSIDATNLVLLLGGLSISILKTVTLNDNQVALADAFISPATYSAYKVEYSISRGVNFRTGQFLIATDGTSTSFFDDYVEQGSTDVTFSSVIVGSDVHVQYTSNNTGIAPIFKYSVRKWSA